MRLGRAIAAAVVAAGLLVGCSSTGSTPTAATSTPVADVACPTNGLEVPDRAPAPATPYVAELLLCQVTLVDRGSQGWWLQLSQRIATHDLGGFLEATRATYPPTMVSCPAAVGHGYPEGVPQLAVDTAGALHRLALPSVGCGGIDPAVVTAAGKLAWGPARTSWVHQVIPAGAPMLGCLDTLRPDLSRYWPLTGFEDGSEIHYVQATTYTRDLVCAIYPPAPTGPVAADLVVARRITGTIARAEAQRALDAHVGISGPDPIGRLMAPTGSMPLPTSCTRPTRDPFLMRSGDRMLGYADLSLCLKAAPTAPGLTAKALLQVVEQLQSNPYEH